MRTDMDNPEEIPHIGIRWRRLDRPIPWKPKDVDEELIGYYLGKTSRNGKFGQYDVVMLAVPQDGGWTKAFMVSGLSVIQAIDGCVEEMMEGSLLRIVWKGMKELKDDRKMKMFEVYVSEGTITPARARAYMSQFSEEG